MSYELWDVGCGMWGLGYELWGLGAETAVETSIYRVSNIKTDD